MKKAFFSVLILIPALTWAKPNAADYAIAVHVQSSQLVNACYVILGHVTCDTRQHLNAVIDGRKYELNCNGDFDVLLRTGDYKARLLPDEPRAGDYQPGNYEYRKQYEFLFPDGKTRKYQVVGESE